MTIYFWLNQHPTRDPVAVVMPAWVPFWPILGVPYLGLLIAPWFLSVQVRDRRRFRECLCTFTLGFFMLIALWAGFPTMMERPPLPDGWWNGMYRAIAEYDRPTNVMPCGHVMPPIVTSWFIVTERRSWLKWAVLMISLAAVSIVTTWQHRPVDIAIGVGISLVAIGIGDRRLRRRWLRVRA